LACNWPMIRTGAPAGLRPHHPIAGR
jgi:hypothetical protein